MAKALWALPRPWGRWQSRGAWLGLWGVAKDVGARPRLWGRGQRGEGLGGVAKAARANHNPSPNPNPKAMGA